MKIILEKNQRYGDGIQLRVVEDERPGEWEDTIVDYRPYSSIQAVRMARKVLEIYNRSYGTKHRVTDVLSYVTPKKASGEKDVRASREALLLLVGMVLSTWKTVRRSKREGSS